jgi:hypothetical protein
MNRIFERFIYEGKEYIVTEEIVKKIISSKNCRDANIRCNECPFCRLKMFSTLSDGTFNYMLDIPILVKKRYAKELNNLNIELDFYES